MARVTNHTYLTRRRKLRWIWHGRRWAYGELGLSEQYDLHRYFHPTREFLDEAALAWRDAKNTTDPSLPQRAGKAYVKILALVEKAQPPAHPQPVSYPQLENEPQVRRQYMQRASERKIQIRAVSHPELDMKKLARAFHTLAVSRIAKESEEQEQPQPAYR
jgi:hypothetical protein